MPAQTTEPTAPLLDPYRLPRLVLPNRYDLSIAPDLKRGLFQGSVKIVVAVRQPTAVVVLNALDLEIDAVEAMDDHGRRLVGTCTLDLKTERCRLTFRETLAPGSWTISLDFRGTMNDQLRGLYRSLYTDETGTVRSLAVTQFEATDARRAFPCWDEPDFKARFNLTLIIDPDLTALSNTAALSEEVREGRKVVRFAETITMSTYLLAFVVGDLEGSAPVQVGRTSIRLWAVPKKTHLMQVGQEIAAASLRFFEDYYGMPYPGDKLDLIAIPDFSHGAMENFGAVTFRERALLIDEASASQEELEDLANVVSHENAHMWFGDLVTMAWWNGIWLNEAFATFMEALAVQYWKPEWQPLRMFLTSRASALSVDGLDSSRPIEYTVRDPKDAGGMFDVLTYHKGAVVLRMLEQFIGEAMFRDGIRAYLRAHAYANAETEDLWASLGKVAGLPISAMMNGWIFQAGYPLLTVKRDGPSHILLKQQRFRYLAPDPVAIGQTPQPPSTWQVPVHVQIRAGGRETSHKFVLQSESMRLAIPTDFDSLVVNEGGHGFYRVRYEPDLFEQLQARLPGQLSSTDRFTLINDAWALCLARQVPIDSYLDLASRFRDERDRHVWGLILESFALLNQLIEARDRPAFARLVQEQVQPAVSHLGWSPRQEELGLTAQLRGDLIEALGTLGDDAATQTRAKSLYHAIPQNSGGIDPNLLPALISIVAHTGDGLQYEQFVRRFKEAVTPQEERRYLFSLAAFRSEPLIARTLDSTLTGNIRTQDAPALLGVLLGNVAARKMTWAFIKDHWETMERLFPPVGLRRMCGAVVNLATPELEHDVRTFFNERRLDFGGKLAQQYLERLHIVVQWRTNELEALRRYLRPFVPRSAPLEASP
ncbi:MAG: M1 family metallopeptidase [Nitrospiraceae bacterium]